MDKKKKVVVYSTRFCPYCDLAKMLLEKKGVLAENVDVTDIVDREEMMARTGGRKTVPQIFIDDHHVGGYDDLMTLENAGQLDAMLGLPSKKA